jgi:hypothetical protein
MALFGCVLEPKLKAAFIFGSGSGDDNWPMKIAWTRVLARGRGFVAARRSAVWAVVLVVAAVAAPAGWAEARDDHERARAAVRAGEVLPLPTLLERLQRTHPGQVLELELERDHERWIYEVKLLQANGQLVKVLVDARTAQVLEARQRK